MKRQRRQTIAHGLTGRQRRRLARRMRDITLGRGRGCFAYEAYPHTMRDARQLHEADLAVAVGTRPSWRFDGKPREITLYRNRSEALERYPRTAIMRRLS